MVNHHHGAGHGGGYLSLSCPQQVRCGHRGCRVSNWVVGYEWDVGVWFTHYVICELGAARLSQGDLGRTLRPHVVLLDWPLNYTLQDCHQRDCSKPSPQHWRCART